MNKNYLFTIFALLPLLLFTNFATGERSAYHDPSHIKQLDDIKAKAKSQVENNLNRFGLSTLKYYDQLADTFFENECKDTVSAITLSFNSTSVEKLKAIAEYKSEITTYTKEKTTAKDSFTGLFRKSLWALGIWIALVLVMIRFRNKKVKKAAALLEKTKAQMRFSEFRKNQVELLLKMKANLSPVFSSALEKSGGLTSSLHQFNENLPAEDERLPLLKDITGKNDLHSGLVKREIRMLDLAAQQGLVMEEKKEKCSINDLCDHLLDIAYRGNCLSNDVPFPCTVTRDLEKNLPELQLYPLEIAEILLIVFDNAFKAVIDHAALAEKGYQAKVAVSTRILPRFIQIRVKDNGSGLPDELNGQEMEEFSANRLTEDSSGTGLALARQLLLERNRGELKIESEKGNGTDIYIKFFLHHDK
jgi:signal transduction histidine kinase